MGFMCKETQKVPVWEKYEIMNVHYIGNTFAFLTLKHVIFKELNVWKGIS